MSAGDERLRVISASSDIDDVAWWCFFFLETCFSGFINLSLFLALHVSKPSACISRMARIHTFKMSGLKQTGQMWGCESETLLHNSDVLKCKVRITQGHCF